ncbi:hypothetical protein ABZ874_05670 [Streptomyces albidoflavus]|uniref:hypothetical protein n=1 Tax=Streptomyces albidoflavus TaxID=1886 RepID=UPI0033E6EBAB
MKTFAAAAGARAKALAVRAWELRRRVAQGLLVVVVMLMTLKDEPFPWEMVFTALLGAAFRL